MSVLWFLGCKMRSEQSLYSVSLLFCNVLDYYSINFRCSGEEKKWINNGSVKVPLLFVLFIYPPFFLSCRYFTLHQTPIFLFPNLSPDRVQEGQEQFVSPQVHANPKEGIHHV